MGNIIEYFFHFNKLYLECHLRFIIVFFFKTEIYDFEVLQYQLYNDQFLYLIKMKLDQIIIHSTCFTYKNGHSFINIEMYSLIIHKKYVHANVQTQA